MSREGPATRCSSGCQSFAGPTRISRMCMAPSQPEAQPPDQVIAAAHVVRDEPRGPGFDHRTRVLGQVALQAAAREQARRIAIRGDQHQGAGFAVGGARCLHEQTQGNRAARGALAFEQGKQGTE